MAKLTLNTIGSRYGSIDALNANFDAIETALENTLSRDGTIPNTMDAPLDMDSNRIINLTDGINNQDAVTLKQVNGIIQASSSGLIASLRENYVATSGQTVFNLASIEYVPGSNNLAVYLDGVRQYPGTSYTETDINTITFSAGLHTGALVMFISNESVDTANLNASAVNYTPIGTGAVATTVQTKLRESVSVKDFGAVGDFNPTTGVGTDDRVAIQAALTYAASIGDCTVVFPSGKYYLGTGYSSVGAGLVAQLLLGSTTVTNAASNIRIVCEGSTIYQGAVGCALALANANNIELKVNMIGYAGGTLAPSRESDNLIGIFQSSKNITLDGCYISNSLGYTIYSVGNPNVAEGGTTETCLNIAIRNSIIKTRYGNGVSTYLGGSKSLWAFASVDSQGVVIQNNVIYGVLDFEPNNLAGQSTYGIFVDGNQFASGFVTPVIPSGVSTYWADEPIGKSNSGGTVINGAVMIVGATGAPVNGSNVVSNNSFDYGTITIGNGVYYSWVLNNSFRLGKINIGSTSGGDTNRYYNISGNTAYNVTDATSGFIVLGGSTSASTFNNNVLINYNLPVISWDGVGGNDAGTNSFFGNTSVASVTNPAVSLGPSGLNVSSVQGNTKGAANEILSFTPNLTDGTNVATVVGRGCTYKVEGRLLTFSLIINNPTNFNGCSAGTYITLPLAKRSDGWDTIVNVLISNGVTTPSGTASITAKILDNSNQIFLMATNITGAATTLVPTTHIQLGCKFEISGSYLITN